MKKILGVILLVALTGHFVQAQSALKKAENTACKCMDESYDENQAFSENEKVAEQCLMAGFMDHYEAFVQEYGETKLAEEAFTYKLGEELGTNLAENCPTFLKFSLQMVQEEGLDEEDDGETGVVSGEVISVEKGALTYLMVQDATGSQQRLLFHSYFFNAERFQDLNALKGKSVSIEWELVNFYDAKQNTFVVGKEIQGLEVL